MCQERNSNILTGTTAVRTLRTFSLGLWLRFRNARSKCKPHCLVAFPRVLGQMQDQLDLRIERQRSPVADDVSAMFAVVRPILQGLLHSLQSEVVQKAGGKTIIDLQMLGRLRRHGDGDCGICYEYAVHEAIQNQDAKVLDRVSDALKQCKVPGDAHQSILFGVEKNGTQQIIATAREILTDDSRLLTGKQSQPPKLRNYLTRLAAAFRRPTTRASLPTSINGLWKADLFLGCTDSDRWIGTSVKINPRALEGANGLRVGIIPAAEGKSDQLRKDDSKNLIICPLPYDGSFMETFYSAWNIVQQFFTADAKLPREVALPNGAHRQVARWLEERRNYPVVEVIDVMGAVAQPELLDTDETEVSLILKSDEGSRTEAVISPIAKTL